MIRVHQLVKCFGDHLAVSGLDLEADKGDILGLIGPNGAGKTTTLRILATLDQADAGTVELAGYDLFTNLDEVRKVVGFMPERFGLYDELSVRDYLDFFARIHKLHGIQRKRRVNDLLELCDLAAKASDGCGTLSKGVRQRLYVAKTLLADPPILLLDEPASGLDPRARIEFRELLRELAGHGKTILISSHILSELDAICNRAVVVEEGRVRYAGALSELEARFRVQNIILQLLPTDTINTVYTELQAHSMIENVSIIKDEIHFEFCGDKETIPQLLQSLISKGHPIYSFAVENRGLESLFLNVTQGVVS